MLNDFGQGAVWYFERHVLLCRCPLTPDLTVDAKNPEEEVSFRVSVMLSCRHTALTQTPSYLEDSFLKIKLNISTLIL